MRTTLIPIAECDSCTDSPVFDSEGATDYIDGECMSCYKCCRCQRCETNRLEKNGVSPSGGFQCPDCKCLVWETGCFPYLCICSEDNHCDTCCKEDIIALSEAFNMRRTMVELAVYGTLAHLIREEAAKGGGDGPYQENRSPWRRSRPPVLRPSGTAWRRPWWTHRKHRPSFPTAITGSRATPGAGC